MTFLFVVLVPQLALPQTNTISFNHLAVEDGLSEGVIHCIMQDGSGFMWFGTQHGLNRYDGYTFKHFFTSPLDSTSVTSDYITTLFLDRHNRLWVGTSDGLCLYRPETGTFHRYYLDSLKTNPIFISSICEDDSILWVGTHNGLIKLSFPRNIWINESVPVTYILQSYQQSQNLFFNSISALTLDNSKRLWVGATNHFAMFDTRLQKFTSIDTGLIEIQSLIHDNNGNIWYGSYNGLRYYNSTSGVISNVTLNTPLRKEQQDEVVKSIYCDIYGGIWVGTYNGLQHFDRSTQSWQVYRNNPQEIRSLSNNRIYSIFEDKSGVLWVGTFGGGVNKTNPSGRTFSTYRHLENDSTTIIHNMVMRVFEDSRGIVWVRTWEPGVTALDRLHGTAHHYFTDPNKGEITAFCSDSLGQLWACGRYGLYKYNPVTQMFVLNPHIRQSISGIMTDHLGVLWLLTPNAEFFTLDVSTGTITHYLDQLNHRPANSVIFSEDINGNLWIVADSLYHYSRVTRSDSIHRFVNGSSVSLPNSIISSLLCTRDGTLWLGSKGAGIFKYDSQRSIFTPFNEKNGLANNFIYGMVEDDQGKIWISSNKGITRFDPQTTTCKNFDVDDGLQGNEFNTDAFFKSRYGEIFFGGVNGFTSFFPSEIHDNTHIPPIVLTRFELFNKPFVTDSMISELHQLTLQHHQNFFSIEFGAMDFVNQKKNSFRYMLEGFDRTWVETGTYRLANYTDIPPGDYVFHVLGSNNDGIWNTKGTSLRITILPPFWATWWFKSVSLLIVIGFIVGITRFLTLRRMRLRMKEIEQQHALEKERLRISKDMHDDLGSRLTQIGLISVIAKRDTNNPEKIERRLKEISETTEAIVQSFDEIVWAVNPKYDTLEGVIDYLAQYAVNYLEKAGIDCKTELPEIESIIHVPADVRHNLFMILKEALNNTLKYANATEVTIQQSIENNNFQLMIHDNGKGFDVSSVKLYSEGLKNMRTRMEEIGGICTIESQIGKGTSITTKVQLS